MATTAVIDLETGSRSDLRKTGVYRYVEDPTARVWMMSYKLDDAPTQRWHPGEEDPLDLLVHVAAGRRVVAHNAGFERTLWNTTLRGLDQSWPRLTIQQMDCTMARALAIHLPADLDTLAIVLGLSLQKDRDGHALMMKMARPRKVHDDGRVEWWDTPENIAREGAYCDQDVEVEYLVDKKVLPLSADERALWELDQRINDRGVRLDIPTIERVVGVLEVAKARVDAEMATLTGGAVEKVTQPLRIVEWLKSRGIPAESLSKGDHAELKAWADLMGDETARAVVELRGSAGKTSTGKYPAMQDFACADDRARGLFGYHRALTGRFGGYGPQPQNLPRVDEEQDLPDVLAVIDILEEFA